MRRAAEALLVCTWFGWMLIGVHLFLSAVRSAEEGGAQSPSPWWLALALLPMIIFGVSLFVRTLVHLGSSCLARMIMLSRDGQDALDSWRIKLCCSILHLHADFVPENRLSFDRRGITVFFPHRRRNHFFAFGDQGVADGLRDMASAHFRKELGALRCAILLRGDFA